MCEREEGREVRERGVDSGSHDKWVLDFPKTILFTKKIYIYLT